MVSQTQHSMKPNQSPYQPQSGAHYQQQHARTYIGNHNSDSSQSSQSPNPRHGQYTRSKLHTHKASHSPPPSGAFLSQDGHGQRRSSFDNSAHSANDVFNLKDHSSSPE